MQNEFLSKYATAPYNFIPLPDKILPSELNAWKEKLNSDNQKEIREAFQEFLTEKAQLSGHIDLELETLTPLFVGGSGVDFFAPAGRKIIPGSSLRGMVKNLLKIITCGSWKGNEDINNQHLYFRCIMAQRTAPAWMKPLHKLYAAKMTNSQNNKKTAKLGFLVRNKDGSCYIYPVKKCNQADEKKYNQQGERILITEYQDEFGDRLPQKGSMVQWHEDKAYIITGSQPPSELKTRAEYDSPSGEEKKAAKKQIIRYISLYAADWSENSRLAVPENVCQDYENDIRRKGVDLFHPKAGEARSAEEVKGFGISLDAEAVSVIPCGYVERSGVVKAFGHGLSFRVPYEHSMLDAVPQELKEDTIDFATALFGDKERFAGRVFFEDAEIEGAAEPLSTADERPLWAPNPTSYQLYLKQTDQGNLNHWDSSGAEIRGYKLYWHHNIKDDAWHRKADDYVTEKNHPRITPIQRGTHFKGKIRFQNLTQIELGALLEVFDLDGNSGKSAYKLGQGKALGLGSVKIQPKLFLDTEETYTKLFTEGRLQDNARETDGSAYLTAFSQYVQSQGLGGDWQDIMGSLAKMLDWDHAATTQKWPERIASMSGDVHNKTVDPRFQNRTILPTAKEVYDGKADGK